MNVRVLQAIVTQLADKPREFAAGWIEGKTRYARGAGSRAYGPSWFDAGTVGRAASQAAIAFYVSLDCAEE